MLPIPLDIFSLLTADMQVTKKSVMDSLVVGSLVESNFIGEEDSCFRQVSKNDGKKRLSFKYLTTLSLTRRRGEESMLVMDASVKCYKVPSGVFSIHEWIILTSDEERAGEVPFVGYRILSGVELENISMVHSVSTL